MDNPNETENISQRINKTTKTKHDIDLISAVPLRKAVEALAIIPTHEKIPLLTRKIYNVLMFQAQAQGSANDIFRARLQDVIVGLDFNSSNTEIIKSHLRQMVSTKVEWRSPSKGEGAKWSVSALIAHAELIKEGNEVVIEWSYAPNIKSTVLDPQRFAQISLAYQAAMKSTPALVLYEICSRYVDNPGGLTARQHWSWWRPVLTSMPEENPGVYGLWKYFNRDVLKGAVADVTQNTNLIVEMILHKQGRTVIDLQFKVLRKTSRSLTIPACASPVNLRDLGRAIAAGLSQERAEKFLAKEGELRFGRAVQALEDRINRVDLVAVREVTQFFSAVLSKLDHEIVPIIPTPNKEQMDKSRRFALLESYRDFKRQEALSLHQESSKSAQDSVVKGFEVECLTQANPALQRAYQSRGLKNPMAKAFFLKFLTKSMFGEDWEKPSDTQLLDFATKA